MSAGTRSNATRYLLGGVLALVAVNAFGGGAYGLAGAEGIPREWLAGSPFESYGIPSLFLFVVVGGGFLAASIAVFARARAARALAVLAGLLVLAWLAVQVAIIGYVSWMQPATAIAGIVVLVLSARLPSRGSRPPRSRPGEQQRQDREVDGHADLGGRQLGHADE